MSSYLKGRDVNGMRSANWGKLDTSDIQLPKTDIDSKSSNIEVHNAICSSIKQMLEQAISALYGDQKQKKYIKIVDMLMLRIRGALQKLYEQNAQKLDEVNEKINDALDNMSASFKKIIDENDKKSNALKLQEIQKALFQAINEKLSENNSQEYKENTAIAKKTSSAEVVDNTYKSDSSIFDENDSAKKSVYSLLLDLQAQIASNFTKIENLIASTSVQKNAETATANAQNTIEKQIINKQKKNEIDVKKQVVSLNGKISSNLGAFDIAKEIKDEKKQDKKEKKDKKKSITADLKNAMTGKQFNMLKKLLSTQFEIVLDTSNVILSRMNKRFLQINSRLDKLIKEQKKNGFSWTKLMLLLSLFIIPLLWDKIIGFFKNDKKGFSEIGEKIEDFVANFDIDKFISPDKIQDYMQKTVKAFIDTLDWGKLISDVKSGIWENVKDLYKDFVSDPIESCRKSIVEWSNSVMAWIKDLKAWVMGEYPDVDKVQKDITQRHEQEIKAQQENIDTNVKNIEKQYSDKTIELEKQANASEQSILNSTNAAQQAINDSTNKLESKANAVSNDAKNLDNELAGISTGTVNDIQSKINGMQSALSDQIGKTVDAESKQIKNNAEEIQKQMRQDGAPSIYTNESIDNVQKDIDKMPESLTEPNVEKLVPIKNYVFVEHKNKEGKTEQLLATKENVNEALNSINSKSNSNETATVQHLRNALNAGEFVDNRNLSPKSNDSKQKANKANVSNAKEAEEQIEEKITPEKFFDEAAVMYNTVDKAYKLVTDGLNDISQSNKKSYDLLIEIKNSLEPALESVTNTLEDISEMKPEIKQHQSNVVIQAKPDADGTFSAEMN